MKTLMILLAVSFYAGLAQAEEVSSSHIEAMKSVFNERGIDVDTMTAVQSTPNSIASFADTWGKYDGISYYHYTVKAQIIEQSPIICQKAVVKTRSDNKNAIISVKLGNCSL